MMKLSLIITTYNRNAELRKVLEGLRYQTVYPDEVIVADDGSTTETETMVKNITQDFPCCIKHVWHEDRGFRAAKIRNEAIKKAEGDYIVFLDGDCVPGRNFIKDHMSLAEKGFFFQGKRILVNRKCSPEFSQRKANSTLMLLKYALMRDISNIHHLLRMPFFPAKLSIEQRGIKTCNMGLFKEDIVAVNGFNQDFVGWGREDSEFATRLYHYGLKRKDHPFMAICFHLWHNERSRKHLFINDLLLKKAIDSNDYFCSNGLVQK